MTERISPDTLTDPRDQAAHWHARLQSEDVTEDERVAFHRWLQASPENVEHYQRIQALWRLAGALPREAVAKLGTQRRPESKRGVNSLRQAAARVTGLGIWRSWRWQVAIGLAMALAWGAGWYLRAAQAPVFQAEYSTQRGQRLQVELPDGSALALNTDTEASVRFFKDRRLVQLARGEVLFEVESKAGVPFYVDAGDARVRVTGTQFNVRRDEADFSVWVLKGAVRVKTGLSGQKQVVVLRTGDYLHKHGAAAFQVRKRDDVGNAAAWREGKIVLRGTPLAQAVQELNRYNELQLRVADPATGRLRVSGVFRLDDPTAFLQALPQIIPVSVRQPGQAEAVIQAR